ncbi:hypothetical protein [Variovorax soli]|uniref:GAF domain-containing protein n=1 Tax=Variovorax soli TaxID=376815 RepID=A0ABU1NCZ8_9BURK|nr:hypothetical protein [Variovorax soli]MDR6536327.1 hypothetical protein [Variovorax soli]
MDAQRFSVLSKRALDEVRLQDARMGLREIPSCALQRLAAALDCDWATYWKVDAVTMTLRAAVVWSKPGLQTASLQSNTVARRLSLSEGTAGHVWRSRRSIWTTDLVRDMCLPRSLDARAAGMQGGIWIAVQTDAEVLGVVEMLGTKIPPPSRALLAAADCLGLELATLLV